MAVNPVLETQAAPLNAAISAFRSEPHASLVADFKSFLTGADASGGSEAGGEFQGARGLTDLIGPQDAGRLQGELVRMSVEVETTAKVVGGVSQCINKLVNMQ